MTTFDHIMTALAYCGGAAIVGTAIGLALRDLRCKCPCQQATVEKPPVIPSEKMLHPTWLQHGGVYRVVGQHLTFAVFNGIHMAFIGPAMRYGQVILDTERAQLFSRRDGSCSAYEFVGSVPEDLELSEYLKIQPDQPQRYAKNIPLLSYLMKLQQEKNRGPGDTQHAVPGDPPEPVGG